MSANLCAACVGFPLTGYFIWAAWFSHRRHETFITIMDTLLALFFCIGAVSGLVLHCMEKVAANAVARRAAHDTAYVVV